MNFASAFVYDDGAEPEEECYEVVSDEEFYEGMDLSDSSSDEDENVASAAPTSLVKATKSPKRHSILNRAMGALRSTATAMGLGREETDGPGKLASDSPGTQASDSKGGSASDSNPPPRSHAALQSKSSSKSHHWKSRRTCNSNGRKKESLLEGKKKNKRMFRRADTNVVSLRFDTLKAPSTMHAGEVIACSACEAIMSHLSAMTDNGPDKVWRCEFCGTSNVVDIEEEEKPCADDVTYLLEPAPSTVAMGTSGRDESIVIFCIDISGSMTITTEVPGQMKLRGSDTLRRLRRENSMEGVQRLPRESRNVTYVSRLQSVQAAVDHQLGEMARDFPHRRVALVTFSYEVSVIGDGTTEEVTISGQKLKDQEELEKIGASLPCPKPIKDTRAHLGEKVFGLEEGGSTALGPALVVALGMASQHPGSKVIVCTDGKSNEGVGKVENVTESDPEPELFYETVADSANSKGVSISVVTIAGTDCKLIHLGKLADCTGGQVNIVDPLKLKEEFSNVLADRIIATSVVATFILHKGLYIGQEENEASKERREVGNVRADHEISFEYGVRKKASKENPKHSPLQRISEVPSGLQESLKDFTLLQQKQPTDEPTTVPPTTQDANPDATDSTPTPTEPAAAAGGVPEDGGSGGGGEAAEEIPPELPFQLQIQYKDVDGNKALRVLTQKKPVTKDRALAEKDADLAVLGVHTERKASELALEGDYSGSRGVALMNQRLGWRSSHESGDPDRRKVYHSVFGRVRTVENCIQRKQMGELTSYGRTHSDEEDELGDVYDDATAGDLPPPPKSKHRSVLSKKKARSVEVEDDMAQMIYQSRSSSTAHVMPPKAHRKDPKK